MWLAVLLSLAAAPAAASTVTLRECYDWAVARSEELAARAADIEVSRARARVSLASALPRLDWNLTDTYQDPGGVRELEQRGFGGFVGKEQIESKFTLTQPVFSGLREQSARAGFKREAERDRLNLRRAESRLYERVAGAFYDVLSHETELASTGASLQLATNRVKELEGFLRLGKARASELYSARAQAAALRAALDQLSARIGSAREDLSRLTGRDVAESPLQDELVFPPPAPTLDEALAAARERADVRARREDVAARRLRVRYERGFRWPTIDLSGNWYTRRATFLDVIDWDLKLEASVPLFRGGGVAAAIKGAEAALRASEALLRELDNDVASAVRKLHRELSAAVLETRSLEDAASAAQDGYDALMKEYRLGLVTNLEVLTALDQLQAQKRARDAARYKTKRLYVQLGVAVESLP
ncbi:MAG: TolC family protein [Elusimicrobia bacterium]|nr:TolC family protein [Elusimicrobiota bacterium]